MKGEGSNANETGGQDRAPPVRECTFSSFMKFNPTPFHGKEGAIELCRWFEKSEMVFSISDCAEKNKVKFAAATLQGRALTWLDIRDTNLFVTITRKITTAIAGQLALTAKGWAILRKTVGGGQLQFVMNVEKRVTPKTIVRKRRTLKVKRLVDELM
nr:reverse transcriptase domain-containing protein [Tanacetum cinerariifolium]